MTVEGGAATADVGEELAAGGGGNSEGNEFWVDGGGTGGGGAAGRGGKAIGDVMSIGGFGGGLMIVGGTTGAGVCLKERDRGKGGKKYSDGWSPV